MKKILIGTVAMGVVVAGVAAMSAYEAHVINVTAKIENALSVNLTEIAFGTVFPNEVVYEDLTISLSQSFVEQDRLDDVQYQITQKPKPRVPEDHQYCIDQKTALFECILAHGGTWQEGIMACYEIYDTDRCYPSLCSFLSKLPDGTPDNDGPAVGVPHDPGVTTWGYLSQLDGDIEDIWTLDLEVPCFITQCSQGEVGYLPPAWESMDFGCDLWIEVTDFSEAPLLYCGDGIVTPPEQCEIDADCTNPPPGGSSPGSCNPPGGPLPCKCKYSVPAPEF